jgi:DNA-binding XRE family transcriptional regulator
LKSKVKHCYRVRKLTAKEAAKYNKARQQIEAEKPDIAQRYRRQKALLFDVHQTFIQLKKIRESQGKSLTDMGKLTGMDRSALSKLENGVRGNFSIDTMIRYAAALGKKIVVSLVDEKE